MTAVEIIEKHIENSDNILKQELQTMHTYHNPMTDSYTYQYNETKIIILNQILKEIKEQENE